MPDEDDGAICPTCHQVIPIERFELHLEGLDGGRPECPRTDLVAVVEKAREAQSRQARLAWTNPFTHGRLTW